MTRIAPPLPAPSVLPNLCSSYHSRCLELMIYLFLTTLSIPWRQGCGILQHSIPSAQNGPLHIDSPQWMSLINFFFNIYFIVYLFKWLCQVSCSVVHVHCSHFSLLVAHGLGCPESCGTLVPWPGLKPRSPALEDTFLTTGTQGRSLGWLLIGILPMERLILVSSFREGKASFYFSNSKTHQKLRIF